MKGFIELTYYSNKEKTIINLSSIESVTNNYIFYKSGNYQRFEESYEEIKQLIKNAQHDN